MSEQSSQLLLRSQASLANVSVDSEGNSILPRGLTQAERHGKAKPRFVEFACSYIEVSLSISRSPCIDNDCP